LGGATGDEVGAGVPADVVEGVEVVGDVGDGCADYGAVLGFVSGWLRRNEGKGLTRATRNMARAAARMTKASFFPVRKSLSNSSSAFSVVFGDAFSMSTSTGSTGFSVSVLEDMFMTGY
jgi:hypothetical protein